MYCVILLPKVSLNFLQTQLVQIFHVLWSESKGSHRDPKLAEEIHIYQSKFGQEPPKKKQKPSPSVTERIYSFHLDDNKDFERKIKLKNDLLTADELSSLPPVFLLITGKLTK